MKAYHIVGPAPLCTNTFLLISKEGNALAIDPAADAKLYNDALEQQGATLKMILLTHGHYDHVGAVRELKEKWGCTVYMDAADAKGGGSQPLVPQDLDSGYVDGGTIALDELRFQTWHTPGHTKGSWVIFGEGMFFTGDTLFSGSIGRTDLPGGSMREMEESLAKICSLPIPDATKVLPGHEELSTLGAEKKRNYYLQDFQDEEE